MLVSKISFKNIGCYLDEVVIDLTAKNYDYNTNYIIEKDDTNQRIVNPAAIYGRNSSGKTTLLLALRKLCEIMTDNIGAINTMFIGNFYNLELQSELSMTIIDDTDTYLYTIVTNLTNIVSESLLLNGNDIFKNYLELQIEDTKSYSVNAKTSVLRSIGREHKDIHITKLYDFFCNIHFIDHDRNVNGNYQSHNKAKNIHDQFENYRNKLEKLDELPILNLEYRENNLDSAPTLNFRLNGISVPFLGFASTGTQKTYELLALLETIKPGSLLIIDEIENSMHPILLKRLFTDFNKYYNTQLIFSTHNTNLMKAFRPDQIFFAKQKDCDHTKSKLKRLSDFDIKIREGHNIEKLYYGGAFDNE